LKWRTKVMRLAPALVLIIARVARPLEKK
jgi:hypothetical protein